MLLVHILLRIFVGFNFHNETSLSQYHVKFKKINLTQKKSRKGKKSIEIKETEKKGYILEKISIIAVHKLLQTLRNVTLGYIITLIHLYVNK